LPNDAEFDERELAVLAAACRQADDLAALEAVIAEEGVVAIGSKGQPRLSSLVTEVRQGRLALTRLLGELDLTDANAEPRTARSRRAQHAATSRWHARDELERRRHRAPSS
jgi:hypothetical protein